MGANKFQNTDAERAVLGIMLTDDSMSRLIPQLMEDDFSTGDNKNIFKAMKSLYVERRPIDLVTMNDSFGKLYPADSARLTGVIMEYSGSILMEKYHVKEYITILKDAAMRRRMLSVLEESKQTLCDTDTDTSAVLEKTRQSLRDIIVTKHSWKSMPDVMMATLDAIERKAKGEEQPMPSGITCLDNVTAGFHKGEMTIIGARPAVGKSAIGAHIALATAEKGYKVGVCSREMTDVQYGMRIIAREARIGNDKIRKAELNEDEWGTVTEAMSRISTMPMGFVFTAKYIEDLRMEVQKKVDSNDIDMLVVDYLQLMQSRQRFDGDWLRIAYVSKMLKDMTVDFNIAVVALAQVGRSAENTMPTLADLRGSGDIEQDADNVIFLHRPRDSSDRYVHPDDKAGFNELINQGRQYIALNVAKQRQGEVGTTAVIFDPARMLYMPIERRG